MLLYLVGLMSLVFVFTLVALVTGGRKVCWSVYSDCDSLVNVSAFSWLSSSHLAPHLFPSIVYWHFSFSSWWAQPEKKSKAVRIIFVLFLFILFHSALRYHDAYLCSNLPILCTSVFHYSFWLFSTLLPRIFGSRYHGLLCFC